LRDLNAYARGARGSNSASRIGVRHSITMCKPCSAVAERNRQCPSDRCHGR
jgi:hypothetical protein